MELNKYKKILLSLFVALGLVVAAPNHTTAQAIDNLDAVNEFLNESAGLGEGSKANPVAVIPINHVDGPRLEEQFYAFVNFKYVARDYIKYQVSYVSCTCREASVNFWQTAYVEMTLPESGKAEDAVFQVISFDKDGSDNYTAGHWGDSDPIPNGTTYEDIKTEYIPYFVGKTYGEISGLSVMEDIDLADYQTGEGREDYGIDVFSGASVSTNNIIRMLLAMGDYHTTDPFFGESETNVEDVVEEEAEAETEATEELVEEDAASEETSVKVSLPTPINTDKEFKANAEDEELTECSATEFSPDCSSIDNTNLIEYLGRDDVLYIDIRDYNDYAKKHFRNFEVIPYFALIFNAEAHTNPDMVQLYGGSDSDPIPVYEESDMLLEVLFPKDKTLFIMCQGGGRVANLMRILEARGWDMSKVYNIGGMAQYSGSEYRDYITDMPEILLDAVYGFEGLTRIVE